MAGLVLGLMPSIATAFSDREKATWSTAVSGWPPELDSISKQKKTARALARGRQFRRRLFYSAVL
jgi:hypothetical protein